MSFAMVTFFQHSQPRDIFFFGIPNVFVTAQAKALAFCLWFCFACFCFINRFVGKFLWIRLNVQRFFLSVFGCFGIARNPFTMFSAHVLYLLCDLFCDEPASSCINFLLQFSSSEVSITSGLSSSKIRPFCNLSKCCSYSVIAIFISLWICASWEISCVNKCQKLLFIGLLLCLIMSSNYSTSCIGNSCIVRNPFAIAFLYTSI